MARKGSALVVLRGNAALVGITSLQPLRSQRVETCVPPPPKDKDPVHTFISWRMALRSVSPGSLNISQSCLYWKYLQRREHGAVKPSDSAFYPNVRVTSDSLSHRVGLLSGLLAHHWSDD